ncbi:MAG: transposase [Acidobacteriia bacterium]|nr:transposase [Terriglobia bacterium]
MRYSEPLKLILESTRDIWNHPETRPAVRENFLKVIRCRTATLGAEIYASESEQKYVYHSCKSRSCPSCGHRATVLWQREQWAALPDIPYVGICLTMPNVLWPLFQQNRHLLHDLPALGAAVIQQWVKARYGARVMIMVVPHTFGRHLTFNAHLHILVSAGGLRESESRWIPGMHFNDRALMHMWRYAVITYLREALRTKVLTVGTETAALKAFFIKQYERWWSIDIAHFRSKSQFLRYAGRYARRPPIAQHRFLEITNREVVFWTKDLREKRHVETRYLIEDFVAALADHVPDRYRHAIRYFGLLAPGSKSRTSAALFLRIGQEKRCRPKRLRWRNSLRKDFGIDPLVDTQGQTMHWIGQRAPIS